MRRLTYVAAPPGELYWRREKCPHRGAKVLLLTIGNVCVTGHWYGELGEAFVAWCPLPKHGEPAPDIRLAPFWERLRFAVGLVFGSRSFMAARAVGRRKWWATSGSN